MSFYPSTAIQRGGLAAFRLWVASFAFPMPGLELMPFPFQLFALRVLILAGHVIVVARAATALPPDDRC